MSNALALAAVSAVLRDLLDTGMINHSVPDVLGPVVISSVAPDTIDLTGTGAKPRLNLFLHQVTPNAAWRNMGLPARDARGGRTGEVPLALDLHYLVTAYGIEDFQAEVLLGYAMQLLHEMPVLARDAIRTALAPTSPVTGSLLPALYHALRAADLADQVEQIRITPVTMNTEEMSRLWSALQAHYRPSASYQVSVVLIDSGRALRSVQPVLRRNIAAVPGMVPPLPFIDRVLPPDGQPAARQGDVVELAGVYLEGTSREVEISSSRLGVRRTITAVAGGGHDLLPFVVPADPAGVPAGVYRVSARVVPPGETKPRTTNELPLVVAPEITLPFLPASIASATLAGAGITLGCTPEVRPGQRASLVLGQHEAVAQPFAAPAGTLTFRFAGLPAGDYLARLRVDGIDSRIIDRTAVPPAYFTNRIVKVT